VKARSCCCEPNRPCALHAERAYAVRRADKAIVRAAMACWRYDQRYFYTSVKDEAALDAACAARAALDTKPRRA